MAKMSEQVREVALSVCDRLESHFGAENRAKLLPWQIELREGIVKVEPVKKATRAKKGGKK